MSQRPLESDPGLRSDFLAAESETPDGVHDRARLRDMLGARLQFETLVARLSATFINLLPEQIDSQIEGGLQQVVEFLGIDRSSLGQFSEDGRELRVTHSYTMPGCEPFPRVDIAPLWPWYAEQVRSGKPMCFTRLPEELPVEAEREKEYCRQTGFRSHLALPLKVADRIIGGLGFGCFGRSYQWSDRLVANLQLVGEIFANALARQRADLALREREARFRLLSDVAPVMVWMSGRDKGCTYFNKPWLAFTGRPLASELGDGWSEGVHPGDLQACLDTYVRAFDARQEFRMEYRLRRADGEYSWVLDTGVPRLDGDGTFEGYIGSCVDITEQKRSAEETQQLRDQLARVGRCVTLGELAASIAHEVNQPLCGIVSNAQSVQRVLGKVPVDMTEVCDAVGDIVADGQRASAILGRIRALLQKSTAERSALDVDEVVHEVCRVIRSEALRRSVVMTLELARRLPRVQGDRVQLQQVVLNLMTNGMDAMDRVAPEYRELVVRSSVGETGNVTVAVTDVGKGFEGQAPHQLFKALYTTKPDSIGMGLAICKSIIDSHGGQIWASQNARWGATFSFSLPCIPEGVS